MFTPRPNGWPAPLTVLKAGGPVTGGVEEREQVSGRGDGKVMKEKMSEVIIEEIMSKVLEGGVKENAICELLPELAALDHDQSGGAWKKVEDEILHSQDSGSANVSWAKLISIMSHFIYKDDYDQFPLN